MAQASAIATHLDYVRRQIEKVPALKKYGHMLEEKTKINAEYFVVGLLSIFAIMLFTGYGAEIVVHVFGFLYPFFATIKYIESPSKSKDDTDWLIYWVVYGFFGVLDTFADFILYWVPFFAPLKLAFLVWCWAPYTKGANVIYNVIIQPAFKKHEDKIDAALKSAAENVKSVIESASGKS